MLRAAVRTICVIVAVAAALLASLQAQAVAEQRGQVDNNVTTVGLVVAAGLLIFAIAVVWLGFRLTRKR
ncbi:hypothetical protein GCM10011575_47940 [Microlunatus endophyticus]|uniref:Uncharacterized protein n=1 Tax=Microlunatus endophyticus TaxID=1716077 RepID=A0A917SIH9_9ACTN|nr:hypothetical protein GCM10011575_47940 [Microlunatus endophyticus]